MAKHLVAAHPSEKTLDALMRTPLADATLPFRHYSAERLWSDEARSTFVEPDLHPLPTAGGLVNNFSYVFPFNSDLYKGDWLLFRLDHNVSEKNSVYVRDSDNVEHKLRVTKKINKPKS